MPTARFRSFAQKDWSSHRAVLFLDPYGMQVDWATGITEMDLI